MATLIDSVLITLQALVLALIAYNNGSALWGWPHPRNSPVGPRLQRFRIVIPAHNEERVVAGAVSGALEQEYPHELASVWVVADRCTDDTAGTARAAGATVAARVSGDGGKGASLAWYLDLHPLAGDEVLVIVDADNRVPPDMLARFNDEIAAGHQALQAYLDVSNPDRSVFTTAGAVSYWASNRMVQQARYRLGWSADLGGTGMAITGSALHQAGGFGDSLTEDADLGARLALAGHPVAWLHDVRVRDEKPETAAVAIRQRARWAKGRRDAARKRVIPLLRAAIRRRSAGLADLAIRMIQPSRTIVAALSVAALATAIIANPSWLLPAWVWILAASIQILLPVAFLVRDGVEARYVVRYPFLMVLAVIWLPVRILSRFSGGWYHTPHRGEDNSPE